jgi:multidrug efflux system outer membrane protein
MMTDQRFESCICRGMFSAARPLSWAIASALLFSLAACATQPPPSSEEIRQQAGTLASLNLQEPWKAAAYSTDSIGDDWLASFNDPQLDALVTEALIKNPDLAVAATVVEQAGQYVEIAKAALRPAIGLFGSGGVKAGGGDPLQAISLGVSWEPDLWGRMRYGRNAAQATYASVTADYEFSRQSLAATVARAWFTASETSLQLQITRDMVTAQQRLLELAETRWRVGPGNEQEVAMARAALGTFNDASRQVELAYSQSVRALELLLGRYPGAELKTRQQLPAMPAPIPVGLPLQMLERRPDMVAAEQRVAAAFNRVGEARAARLPSIVLNANVAAFSSNILQLAEDFNNPTGGAGARLLAPIYQGGALKTQVEIRTLEQKEAVADYARMALRALGDVENGLAASENLAERQALLTQAVADNERALVLTEKSYRVGKSDLRAVQQQLITLQSSRQALLRVESERLSQRTTLHLALGGSFEEVPATQGEANDSITGQ